MAEQIGAFRHLIPHKIKILSNFFNLIESGHDSKSKLKQYVSEIGKFYFELKNKEKQDFARYNSQIYGF